jgi:SAM-dependent methyltransferase
MPDAQVVYEHLHRYLWAAPLIAGRSVLDLASGEGFGAATLAGSASSVVGVDIDERTVEHSRLNYVSDNLRFTVADGHDLSAFEEGEFGAVVAFEMIEHLSDQARVLDEIQRVLEPQGVLIVSTPDKDAYAEVAPNNPFHVRELDRAEFTELLQTRFENVAIFGQHAVAGSAIASIDGAPPAAPQRLFAGRLGDDWRLGSGFSPMFLLAVASNGELPAMPSDSTLADAGLAIVKDTQARHDALQAELESKVAELMVASRDLTEATRNQERMLERIAELEVLVDHQRGELSRRSVRAALRVANALRRR